MPSVSIRTIAGRRRPAPPLRAGSRYRHVCRTSRSSSSAKVRIRHEHVVSARAIDGLAGLDFDALDVLHVHADGRQVGLNLPCKLAIDEELLSGGGAGQPVVVDSPRPARRPNSPQTAAGCRTSQPPSPITEKYDPRAVLPLGHEPRSDRKTERVGTDVEPAVLVGDSRAQVRYSRGARLTGVPHEHPVCRLIEEEHRV